MPTIGAVGYLNARPLVDGLDRDAFSVVTHHPGAVAAALHAGEVDVALVPVAALLDGGDWRVLGGWCIGADGPVDSVLLVAETPPEAWTHVALDGESRTSAVLAQLLLRHGPLAARVRAGLTVATVSPGTGVATATGTTASLVIGDAALALPDRLVHRIDLAATWRAWTSLPFVFAVWAGRPGVDRALLDHLRRAAAEGVATIPDRFDGADRAYLAERIRYTLDDRALMGLRRFAALARAAGLVAAEDLQLYGPADVSIPRPATIDALLERAVDGDSLTFDEAVRLEVGAPLDALLAAADLKRSAGAPDRVDYRLGWRLDDPARLPAAIAAGATEIHLRDGATLDAARAAWPDVRFVVGRDPELTVVLVGAGESSADRVRAILALRDRPVGRVTVVAADQPGKPAASEANTAVDHLRAVALVRLLTDVTRLEASPATEGLGMAQVSLRAGSDHLGTVFPTEPLDRWADAIAEIERQIRDAGFEPARERRGAGKRPTAEPSPTP